MKVNSHDTEEGSILPLYRVKKLFVKFCDCK